MRKVRVPRMFRMHSEDREEIPSAEAGDIVAFYGVEASSGETFTDGKVSWTLTSMHVPAAVISLAVAPKDRSTEVNFSKALNRFTKEDPTFRVHQDEESQQTIISGMGELHLDIYMERMKRGVQLRRRGRQAAGRVPRVDHPQGGDQLHAQEADRGSGQYAKIMGYIEPAPVRRGRGLRVPRRRHRRLHPARVHLVVRQGLQGRRSQGHDDRLPDRRHPLRGQRRRLARGRLLRNGVQDRRDDGLPRGVRQRGPDHPRADHEGRDRRPQPSSRARSSVRSTSAAASSSRRSVATPSASRARSR